MNWLAVLAVIGTLAGVGLGGIIGYETQKRLQERQRELDLDEQQRQRKRNQLNELSNEYYSLAIRTSELKRLESIGHIFSEQDARDLAHDSAKATVKLASSPHVDVLVLLYSRHESLLLGPPDFMDLNQKLQPIIQELIDETYDPNFSVKTALSAENYGVDPDEYQKFVENLSKMKNT